MILAINGAIYLLILLINMYLFELFLYSMQ